MTQWKKLKSEVWLMEKEERSKNEKDVKGKLLREKIKTQQRQQYWYLNSTKEGKFSYW